MMRVVARDERIRELVKSWHPLLRLSLFAIAVLAAAPVIYLLWPLLYYIYVLTTGIESFYRAENAIDTFFFFNARFGGFLLICFLLIYKRGKIADVVLAPPAPYGKIEIGNVYLRTVIYLMFIFGFGFFIQAVRFAFGLSPALFSFRTGLWDFALRTFFAPISEEVYYRFLMLYITDSVLGRRAGIAFSLIMFGLSHDYSVLGIFGILWVASLGLAAALMTISTGSLWLAIAIHSINNTIVYFYYNSF